MSIFMRPVSQLTPEDLEELVAELAVENVRLEFKREVPTKDETLKKLSSFANTFGGFVVIGAEANSTDGRIVGLPGVDVQPGYKQTVAQWCFGGVSPPLAAEVSDPIPTPARNGKVCYVLYISESELAPHFLNGRKGVYVRTDEFSSRFEAQLARENELRHLLDRRKLIRDRRTRLVERARRRFQSFTEQRYQEFSRGTESIGARFDLAIVPRFPARPVCDHAHLLTLLKAKSVNWRGVGFPRDALGFISQHESVIALRPGSSFSMLEANVWGMLFYATEIEEKRKEYSGIHLNQFLGNLLVFIEHASLMLREFGYVGSLRVELMMNAVRGVPWIYFDRGFPEVGRRSELDDAVWFSIAATSDDLIDKPDGIAMNVLRYIFFATTWPEVADSPEKLENLIKAGYEFNGWRQPHTLRS